MRQPTAVTTDPSVIAHAPPCRSSQRPTAAELAAITSSDTENPP